MKIPYIGNNCAVLDIFGLLPSSLRSSLEKEVKNLPLGADSLYEIRLRAEGQVSLVTSCGVRHVPVRLTYSELSEILTALTGGALYAHRDTIAKGYVTVGNGQRVGVCGRARYENGALVGVSEVRSLVFRIAHGHFELENELFGIWQRGVGHGLLIYSPPMGGKTSAIRRLAARIGERGTRVCVVDERCEFRPEDYRRAEVELLRGYSKPEGIEIAVRTLGAEVVVVDELGAAEVKSVEGAMMLGVPIIATAHAASKDELFMRTAFSGILNSGAFDTLVGILSVGGVRRLKYDRLVTGGVCSGI